MPNPAVCLEALSALSGCCVQSTGGPSQLSPQDFVNVVALKEFYRQEGLRQLDYPSLGSLCLDDMYSSPPALTAAAAASGPRVTINPADFFHAEYNYDFTRIQDGDKQFLRGNEPYIRPCGWDRAALRVLQKYDDGNAWLGTGQDAWPVSYHGHNMDGSVILNHSGKPSDEPQFGQVAAASLLAGETRGRGVYSTPDIKEAEKYCKVFESKVDGKKYKVVLQNRIKPQNRKKCQRENVWLVYVPENSTDIQARAVVQESIRPYGLLLKQV
ncbi:uncharacterized protein LOC114866146 [Betta splendens]|uniref:Uncharacterized protein LOC114866146 n=1 Tax=Betta splendens TaxID=158456 RepID=A0A9W2Y3S6_BETSP|nr:uncharacterized protein LOC114866146 [Betta splendens]